MIFDDLIDTFVGGPGPISGGGDWRDLLEAGANDVVVSNEFPFSSGVAAHRHTGLIGSTAGPGNTLRVNNPGFSYEQAIAGLSVGVRGEVNMLARYSLDGQSGYRAEFRNGSDMDITLIRVDAGVDTTIGTFTVTGDTGQDGHQGIHAHEDTIDVYHWGFSGSPILALSVVDATYPAGYLGFGIRGGVFGTAEFDEVRGFGHPYVSAIGRGLHAAPFTFQYSNDPVHVIPA